jgi:hypothetical protein
VSAEETHSGAGASGEASAADLVAAAFAGPQAETAALLAGAESDTVVVTETMTDVVTETVVTESVVETVVTDSVVEESGTETVDMTETITETVTESVTETETKSVTESEAGSETGSETEAVMETVAAFAAASESASPSTSESASANAETVVAAAVAQPDPNAQATGAFPPPDPQQQGAPHLDPAAFFSMLSATTEAEAAAAKPKRRALKLAGRYALVLLTLGAIGAGTAYAVTLPKRTDIPTLKTKDDGRYDFPGLAKPRPAAGALGPSDKDNATHTHSGDPRSYLLPLPKGATLDSKYPAAGGWVKAEIFAHDYDFPAAVQTQLSIDGVRDIAARAWTTPDGQRTTIMLLQFPDEDAAADYIVANPGGESFGFADDTDAPVTVTVADVAGGTRSLGLHEFTTVTAPAIPDNASGAGLIGRRATWQVGDMVAVVLTSAPKALGSAPTVQLVQLESRMLV